MRLEDGYEKIRIARTGVNQDKVNRFLRWVKAQGYIVWDIASDNRYEIDGISKKTQKEIQCWLESIGRKFKQPILRSGIMCKADGCFNESEYGQLYCIACHQHQRIEAEKRARQQAAAYGNPCLHPHCKNEARRHSHFCFTHRDDRNWAWK